MRDFGRGVPAEFRHRIFQRFSQADSSDTREKGGTGLGLSIAKAIVERHGGNLAFTSEEGVGTEFFFDLPEWRKTIDSLPHKDHRPRMLICEEDQNFATLLSDLLEHEGVASDLAETGKAALNMLQEKHYRGLLLDLALPDIDGLALIQCLRSNEATQNLPVIVISSRIRENENLRDGQALAVLDWLQKPVDRERLGQVLQHVLHRQKRPTILHVEDDPDVIQVIRTLLEEYSDYAYATSLVLARQMLARNHYDLLLLDITLPDGSGLELLDIIKEDTKVIIFSGQEAGEALKYVNASVVKATTSNTRLFSLIKQIIQEEKTSDRG